MIERIRVLIALILINTGARILPPAPERTPEDIAAANERIMKEIMRVDCHARRNGSHDH